MNFDWSILDETTHWLVINKPSGLNVEPVWDYPCVENQVRQYLKQTGRRAEPYVGIVHRLDRPVSGALILAKKKSSLRALNQQFAQRQVEKRYWAVCAGHPPSVSGMLQHHLVKDQKRKRSFVFDQPRKGSAPVKLTYKTLQSKADRSWLEIELHTGKFHQIRVQLAAMGCPIIGDQKYGSELADAEDCIALHARSLRFFTPEAPEQAVLCVAPVPSRTIWQME